MGPSSSHGWAHFPRGFAVRAGRPGRRRRTYRRSPAGRRGQPQECAATILPRFNIAGLAPGLLRSLLPSAPFVRHSDAAQFGDASDFDPFHDEDVSLVVEAGTVRRDEFSGSEAIDRKSTRLNSRHLVISYAVF